MDRYMLPNLENKLRLLAQHGRVISPKYPPSPKFPQKMRKIKAKMNISASKSCPAQIRNSKEML